MLRLHKVNKQLLILLLIFSINACSHKNKSNMSTSQSFAFRLKPGADLKKSIQALVNEHKIKAGWIATCVGSLTNYSIRFANQEQPTNGVGHFEIVSLAGTLSENGSHLHVSLSDSTGKTIGGHLMEGNIVYTTAEIVIQYSDSMIFKRENDGSTPWKELQIENTNQP